MGRSSRREDSVSPISRLYLAGSREAVGAKTLVSHISRLYLACISLAPEKQSARRLCVAAGGAFGAQRPSPTPSHLVPIPRPHFVPHPVPIPSPSRPHRIPSPSRPFHLGRSVIELCVSERSERGLKSRVWRREEGSKRRLAVLSTDSKHDDSYVIELFHVLLLLISSIRIFRRHVLSGLLLRATGD